MKIVKLIRHAWRNCHMRRATEGFTFLTFPRFSNTGA